MSSTDVDEELRARFEDAYDANGVDRTLIRASLDRTPEARLAALEENLSFITAARASLKTADA